MSFPDRLRTFLQQWTPAGSATGSVTVTPDDSNDLPTPAIALRVDVGGTVKFTAADGTTDTWTCQAGDQIAVAVTRVWATGTSASGIHAMTYLV